MTTAVADDGILHFGLPMTAPEVSRLDTWHTLGMRGTGSQDVAVEGFFLAEDKVALKRPPAGQVSISPLFPSPRETPLRRGGTW
jgi:alkylation response protein AidB-like acyl-CoA dehydrogenase